MSGSKVSITGFMFGFMDKVRMAVHSPIVNGYDGYILSKAKQQPLIKIIIV